MNIIPVNAFQKIILNKKFLYEEQALMSKFKPLFFPDSVQGN
jgi:hypothetical protein